jgi:gamma-glutamylcyclotransferase (GGCT)/AIG2-like uncharacterized protein YtfP
MNFKQMKERCSSARFVTRAKLHGYRFVYDGYSSYRNGAVANIIKSDSDTVEGGVFEINEECLKNLDRCEGYPKSYDRRPVEVVDDNGKSYNVIVYLRKPQEIGRPSNEYRNIILEGARDCGLSQDYIKKFLVVLLCLNFIYKIL